jgi:hypothetical protein
LAASVSGSGMLIISALRPWWPVMRPCPGDDRDVLVVRPHLGEPGSELFPFGSAGLAGD